MRGYGRQRDLRIATRPSGPDRRGERGGAGADAEHRRRPRDDPRVRAARAVQALRLDQGGGLRARRLRGAATGAGDGWNDRGGERGGEGELLRLAAAACRCGGAERGSRDEGSELTMSGGTEQHILLVVEIGRAHV